MNPTQLDLEAPRPQPRNRKSLEARLRSAAKAAVLVLHRQADRFDLVPSEFGKDVPVNPDDGGALAREWWRQAKLWAAYNPEEMFAIKAGAVALGLALVVLVLIVGAVR